MAQTPSKKANTKKVSAPTKKATAKKATAPTTRRTPATAKAAAPARRVTNGNGKHGNGHTAADANGNGTHKLGKGGLESLVKEFLRANPDTEFTPGAIARALVGRSPGAVQNALEKWAEDRQPVVHEGKEIGTVVQTKDRPKSFTLVTKKASKPARRTRKS
jgi:hypothetical protein